MIELVLRLVLALAVVLGVIWALARFSGRRLGSSGHLLGVVGRQSLGRSSSVAVVSVAGRLLVLGVAEQQVTLLTELDLDEAEPYLADRAVAQALQVETEHVAAQPAAQPAAPTAAPASGSHRAAAPTAGRRRAAPAATPAAGIDGSLLSPGTWRAAWLAVTRGSTA